MADDLLAVFLGGRDVPCPACGYNLRDLTTSRCPECGHVATLRVGLADRDLKAWITLLVVCCLGAETGLVVTVPILILWLGLGMDFADAMDWVVPPVLPMRLALIASLAALAMTAGVVAFRRHFVRMEPATQWVIVAWAVLYVLTGYALFAWGIL